MQTIPNIRGTHAFDDSKGNKWDKIKRNPNKRSKAFMYAHVTTGITIGCTTLIQTVVYTEGKQKLHEQGLLKKITRELFVSLDSQRKSPKTISPVFFFLPPSPPKSQPFFLPRYKQKQGRNPNSFPSLPFITRPELLKKWLT